MFHSTGFFISVLLVSAYALPIEKREPKGGAIGAAADIAGAIIGAVERDKEVRGQFTQDHIAKLRAADPSYNYAMAHTKHKTNFEGQEGTDWKKLDDVKYDAKIGGDKGYQVYAFKKGEFTNEGDGGYINWAYNGNVNQRNGGQVKFDAPPPPSPPPAPAAKDMGTVLSNIRNKQGLATPPKTPLATAAKQQPLRATAGRGSALASGQRGAASAVPAGRAAKSAQGAQPVVKSAKAGQQNPASQLRTPKQSPGRSSPSIPATGRPSNTSGRPQTGAGGKPLVQKGSQTPPIAGKQQPLRATTGRGSGPAPSQRGSASAAPAGRGAKSAAQGAQPVVKSAKAGQQTPASQLRTPKQSPGRSTPAVPSNASVRPPTGASGKPLAQKGSQTPARGQQKQQGSAGRASASGPQRVSAASPQRPSPTNAKAAQLQQAKGGQAQRGGTLKPTTGRPNSAQLKKVAAVTPKGASTPAPGQQGIKTSSRTPARGQQQSSTTLSKQPPQVQAKSKQGQQQRGKSNAIPPTKPQSQKGATPSNSPMRGIAPSPKPKGNAPKVTSTNVPKAPKASPKPQQPKPNQATAKPQQAKPQGAAGKKK